MSCSDQLKLYQRLMTIDILVLPQPHIISASQSLIASKSFTLTPSSMYHASWSHHSESMHIGTYTASWTWASNVPLWQRQQMVSWAALDNVSASWGRWPFLSTQQWWGHTWSTGSSSGLPSTREAWTYWSESSKGPLRRLRDWSVWGKANRAGTVPPGEGKAQGDLIKVYK